MNGPVRHFWAPREIENGAARLKAGRGVLIKWVLRG
jgi:hypothetical protein